MDFQDFSIDRRLIAALQDRGTSAFLFEELLSHSLIKGENVCARITLDEGREEVILLPALQWILAGTDGERRKVLVASHDLREAGLMADAVRRIGSGAGISAFVVGENEPGDGEPTASVTGDPGAAVVLGSPEALLASASLGLLSLRDFGFLVVDGAERLAERPSELMRKFAGALLPSWERRSLLACSRVTVKAKNLAWDLADNPCEISVDGEAAKAQSVAKETWRVASDAKLRFLLAYLERERPGSVCVFCNLRDTAEELSRRLEANGIASDYILGALAADRKRAVLEKVEAGRYAALVLTDAGAEGLPAARFPLVVNYDFPLEPELFVKRLEMLDRGKPAAKILSIACDRYIFGLPAVEQYIAEKMEAREADESMLAAEDKSAGMSFDRRSPSRDERGRDERRGPGPSGRAPGGRDDRGRRDGRRGGYPREDRGPDIRRSIAEATGGSLDVGGEPSIEKSRDRARAPEDRAPAPRRQGGRDERRGQRRGDGRDNRRGGEGARGDRQAQRDRPRGAERPSGNPYELPMEERMKRYREKYGQRVVEQPRRNPVPGPRNARDRSQGGGTRIVVERNEPRAALPPEPDAAEPRGSGILGRLFGSAQRKKHE